MGISIQEILIQLSQKLRIYSETATLDSQVLLAHYLEKPRSWILAHPEARLNETQFNQIIQASDRLLLGEPLPYVIGHWEFYGMDFHLTRDVLIPRPETELLVERAINWMRVHPDRRKAIDVGTGSGCIGITLAKNIPDLHIHLTDISSDALEIARENANNYGLLGRTEFTQTDLLEGITGAFDLICANLPYIPTPLLMTLPVAEREPLVALDGGPSGIVFIDRLLDQATHRLAPGGLIVMEIESSQGSAVKNLAEAQFPTSIIQVLKDLSGQDRCVEIERSNLIIHLCPRKEWFLAQQSGVFQDQSLLRDGFIHCSQPDQILGVANLFYHGIADLVLLWIDPDRVTSEIRWESVDAALFPHIYGPINLEAVTSVTDLLADLDGIFRVIQPPD
jgi:release factor glutamine methyltransferase